MLYGPPTDAAAFEEYYANTHLPLAAKLPNVARFEASKVIGTPDGGEPPYYRIAEATGDIANFATGGATVVISEVD